MFTRNRSTHSRSNLFIRNRISRRILLNRKLLNPLRLSNLSLLSKKMLSLLIARLSIISRKWKRNAPVNVSNWLRGINLFLSR